MDPTLSLLMANIASIKSSSLVLDPFVGTGKSLIDIPTYIACHLVKAHFVTTAHLEKSRTFSLKMCLFKHRDSNL